MLRLFYHSIDDCRWTYPVSLYYSATYEPCRSFRERAPASTGSRITISAAKDSAVLVIVGIGWRPPIVQEMGRVLLGLDGSKCERGLREVETLGEVAGCAGSSKLVRIGQSS